MDEERIKFSRRNHKTVHDHGWNVTLDGHTGQLTAKRKGRIYTSLPRLPNRRDDRAPPGMPF
jgi:hypothetical protein